LIVQLTEKAILHEPKFNWHRIHPDKPRSAMGCSD
jgi:hypothetical protein